VQLLEALGYKNAQGAFGDSWRHEIVFEGNSPADPKASICCALKVSMPAHWRIAAGLGATSPPSATPSASSTKNCSMTGTVRLRSLRCEKRVWERSGMRDRDEPVEPRGVAPLSRKYQTPARNFANSVKSEIKVPNRFRRGKRLRAKPSGRPCSITPRQDRLDCRRTDAYFVPVPELLENPDKQCGIKDPSFIPTGTSGA